MLSVVISVKREKEGLQRLLWGLASADVKPGSVVVVDEVGSPDVVTIASRFSSAFHQKVVRPGGMVPVSEFAHGDKVLFLPACVVPTKNAIAEMLADGSGPKMLISTLACGPMMVEGLDDFGTNLSQKMIEDCTPCSQRLLMQERQCWVAGSQPDPIYSKHPRFIYFPVDDTFPFVSPNLMVAAV